MVLCLKSGERCNALDKDLLILLGNFHATSASGADGCHSLFSNVLSLRPSRPTNDTAETPGPSSKPAAPLKKVQSDERPMSIRERLSRRPTRASKSRLTSEKAV